MFDSHIHLDQYSEEHIDRILTYPDIQRVMAVATDLASSKKLLALKQRYANLAIASGFHPEQPLPNQLAQKQLFSWIEQHRSQLHAIGEVGLPHYLQRANPNLDYRPYIALLEQFIQLCKRSNLPIILHIVYQDTDIALDLLAKYQLKKAHFHWFKAEEKQLQRLLESDYMVSVTPDILTNPKTQRVVKCFPLSRLMVETDGPWQHLKFDPVDIPLQLSATMAMIAQLKKLPFIQVKIAMYENASKFYSVN